MTLKAQEMKNEAEPRKHFYSLHNNIALQAIMKIPLVISVAVPGDVLHDCLHECHSVHCLDSPPCLYFENTITNNEVKTELEEKPKRLGF